MLYRNTELEPYSISVFRAFNGIVYSNRFPMPCQFGRLKEHVHVLYFATKSSVPLELLVVFIHIIKLALRQLQYNLCKKVCQYAGKQTVYERMGYVVLYDVICSYIALFRVISYRENFYHARPLSPVNGRNERQSRH